jgi:hypothetical protein
MAELSHLPDAVDKFDRALTALVGTGGRMVVREAAKRLMRTLRVKIEPLPDSLEGLYRRASECLRSEEWMGPVEQIPV